MSQNNILLESGTNELEVVEFYIDEVDPENPTKSYRGYYGVNVAKVLEIIRMPQVTKMQGNSHPSVMGAFNLRSKVIPLVNLSQWLGKEQVNAHSAKVIVSEFNNVINAFQVSGVTRIHRLSWEQVEPPDLNLAGFCGNSITGVVRFTDRIMLILDMESIIGDLNPSLAMRLEDVQEQAQAPEDMSYRALIADDSTSIRRMIGKILEKAGFTVERTINGQMAWDKLLEYKQVADADNRPISDYLDIVISDIEMPKMDGHNLTKRIKEDPVLKTLPVILFSSLITERLWHKGESVGADDQISKPEITYLAQRAAALIEGRERD